MISSKRYNNLIKHTTHKNANIRQIGRIISLYDNLFANYQSLCPKCAQHTRTQCLRCNATGW